MFDWEAFIILSIISIIVPFGPCMWEIASHILYIVHAKDTEFCPKLPQEERWWNSRGHSFCVRSGILNSVRCFLAGVSDFPIFAHQQYCSAVLDITHNPVYLDVHLTVWYILLLPQMAERRISHSILHKRPGALYFWTICTCLLCSHFTSMVSTSRWAECENANHN